jgi:hypothetical protein
MKKFTTTILFLLGLTFFAPAQSIEWQQITPDNEEFSVEMPQNEYFSEQNDTDTEKNRFAVYRAKTDDAYFFVSTAKDKLWLPLERIEALTKENNAVTEKVYFGKIEGNKFRFTDADAFHHQIVIASTTERFYLFHVVSTTADDKKADRMTGSITFTKTVETIKSEPEKIKSATDTPNPLSDSERYGLPTVPNSNGGGVGSGSGRGGGFGTGEGPGTGSGIGSGQNPPKPPVEKPTTAIRILSKPKPGYTDLARFYNITGMVRVRVTFLADGQIGGVEPIQKLPFGLTASAMKAAWQIRFSPPLREGIPYSVNKIVVYNFMIY